MKILTNIKSGFSLTMPNMTIKGSYTFSRNTEKGCFDNCKGSSNCAAASSCFSMAGTQCYHYGERDIDEIYEHASCSAYLKGCGTT